MNPAIAEHLPQIKVLCERFGVVKLDMFGSATGPDFDLDKSDFDFIARFATTPGIEFIQFADALEVLLGRKVDPLSDKPIKNPYLARAVDATRTTIFESTLPDAVV